MAKHMECLNGTIAETNKYSSPVPIVGFYIAVGSMACLLLIVSDIWSGFRRRKLWFPCQLFSLNSVTLTLISVASKIPVDLTTYMPAVEDQLSKLTGTVFICMTIAFMIPSIGISREFESYANLTALTIFVVTVLVNICIQMATGIIYRFILEHAIILFCMSLLLIRFWGSVIIINSYKRTIDINKALMRTGEESMLQRLKICYLNAYNSSTQLYLSCKFRFSGNIGLVCATCLVVLGEVMLRSLVFMDLKFCGGISDYGWSMWLILGIQVVTIGVISLAILCRWLILAKYLELDDSKYLAEDPPYLQFLYLFSFSSCPRSLEMCFRIVYLPLMILDLVLTILNYCLAKTITTVIEKIGQNRLQNDRRMEEYEKVLQAESVEIKQWVLKKGVDDLERWMDMNRNCSSKHLMDLLLRVRPSEEFFTSPLSGLSSLSIVLLGEIVKLSIPSSLNVTLTNSLSDVIETIDFIDNIINVGSSQNRLRSMYAKIIWKFGLNWVLIYKKRHNEIRKEVVQSDIELDNVLKVFRKIEVLFKRNIVRNRTVEIITFLLRQSYSSTKELFDEMERTFVGMLHVCLSQLPNAIFKYVVEGPVEEYEERARYVLGLVCKLELLCPHITWTFPTGSNLTRLGNSQPGSNNSVRMEECGGTEAVLV